MTWNLENSIDRQKLSKFPPSWPNEMLVKILSSLSYSPIIAQLDKPINALEVGIFSGNNARFLLDNGYRVTGSEINEEMINLCRSNLERLGYEPPPVEIGNNTNLPFAESNFDLLISVNTIHYSAGVESDLAIKEFARVVRPGGFAVIETPGMNHFAVSQSKKLSEKVWEWHAGGFRELELFGFFDSEDHFRKELLGHFQEVDICQRLERYKDVTLEFWTAICKK